MSVLLTPVLKHLTLSNWLTVYHHGSVLEWLRINSSTFASLVERVNQQKALLKILTLLQKHQQALIYKHNSSLNEQEKFQRESAKVQDDILQNVSLLQSQHQTVVSRQSEHQILLLQQNSTLRGQEKTLLQQETQLATQQSAVIQQRYEISTLKRETVSLTLYLRMPRVLVDRQYNLVLALKKGLFLLLTTP